MENSENTTALFVQSSHLGTSRGTKTFISFVRINIAETEFEDKFWPEDNTKETPEPGNVICVAAFFQILNGLDLALLTGRDMDLKPIEVSGKTPIHFNRL